MGKLEELEEELKKLDADRRGAEVRLRRIEQNPRNRRILAGDFAPRARRFTNQGGQEGGTQQFFRVRRREGEGQEQGGKGKEEQEEGNKKRRRVEEADEGEKKEKEAVTEKEDGGADKEGAGKSEEGDSKMKADKEDEEDKDDKDDDKVDYDEETKEDDKVEVEKEEQGEAVAAEVEKEKVKETSRRTATGKPVRKRDQRMFAGLLGHLGKAKEARDKDRTTSALKKKLVLEAKVEKRIADRSIGIVETEAKALAEKRSIDVTLKAEIVAAEEVKWREYQMLASEAHETLLSAHFILTKTTPAVYYVPKVHTEVSKKRLRESQKRSEKRLDDGLVYKEKKLDQAFIDKAIASQQDDDGSKRPDAEGDEAMGDGAGERKEEAGVKEGGGEGEGGVTEKKKEQEEDKVEDKVEKMEDKSGSDSGSDHD